MDGHPDYPFPGYPYPSFPSPGSYDDFDNGCEPCPDCGGHIPVMDDDDDSGDEGFSGGHSGMGGYDSEGYDGGYPGTFPFRG
jgi:hypothetical protein